MTFFSLAFPPEKKKNAPCYEIAKPRTRMSFEGWVKVFAIIPTMVLYKRQGMSFLSLLQCSFPRQTFFSFQLESVAESEFRNQCALWLFFQQIHGESCTSHFYAVLFLYICFELNTGNFDSLVTSNKETVVSEPYMWKAVNRKIIQHKFMTLRRKPPSSAYRASVQYGWKQRGKEVGKKKVRGRKVKHSACQVSDHAVSEDSINVKTPCSSCSHLPCFIFYAQVFLSNQSI